MNEVEDTRLKEFRQLKKEIRGSKEHLIVGIDVAKEKHHAFFGTATGKTLFRRLIFDNTVEGFEKLLTQVRAIQVALGLPKVVFGLTIKTTDERIRETCRQFPEYGYLLTIPGFGPDISAKVIGALGNPFRFQNRKQVLKMAGLDLSADRSGKTSDTATRVFFYLNVKYGHCR
jgi:transposase